MTEQYNNQELIQTLVQEIYSLKNEVASLKNELDETRVLNTDLTNRLVKLESHIEQTKSVRKIFNKKSFMKNPTVDYLSVCKLDRVATEQLLNMMSNLDFSCTKYLIDLWVKCLYDWNDVFTDYSLKNGKMLIHFVCKHGCEEAVLYILDIYAKKDLDLECETKSGWNPIYLLCRYRTNTPRTIDRILDIYTEKNLDLESKYDGEWPPIRLLCRYGTSQTIDRILNIYAEKNLDLECVMTDGWTLLHLLSYYGPEQSIVRMGTLYVERNYNLEQKTPLGNNPLHFVCKNKTMYAIKFMIDTFVQQKLSLDGVNGESLEACINANPHLNNNNNNNKRVMCMYLNTLETEIFI